MRWLLPEHIEDVLPRQAAWMETLRRTLLDTFRAHGYQLVVPPLLEYLESLLTGTGRDLDLRTFKLVDQLSGRTMGVRADITPQVARIDAHLLNRRGVARLCYAGSVLHTLPSASLISRQPIQVGAELYGHAGIEADVEVVRLLKAALDAVGLAHVRFDFGHIGVFRALTEGGEGLSPEDKEAIFAALQAKDHATIRSLVRRICEPYRSALLSLADYYGGREILAKAEQDMASLPQAVLAVRQLASLIDRLGDIPVSIDLADLRGYHYHSGMVFAAYASDSPGAVAQGGRYDHIGRSFGRGRPATGFSLDLRELSRIAQAESQPGAILAPLREDRLGLEEKVSALRSSGEVVMDCLPGHEGTWTEAGCDRKLVIRDGNWVVVPLEGE